MSGSTLVEVLVALVLTALGAGAFAAVAATSGRALDAARRDAAATALATAALETLRAGPRQGGADATTRDGVTFVRQWTATPGRGRPDAFSVTVVWPGHAIALDTEAAP